MDLQALENLQRSHGRTHPVPKAGGNEGEESTLMRLNKSMAKVIFKLGARVTTLEAKVAQPCLLFSDPRHIYVVTRQAHRSPGQ